MMRSGYTLVSEQAGPREPAGYAVEAAQAGFGRGGRSAGVRLTVPDEAAEIIRALFTGTPTC